MPSTAAISSTAPPILRHAVSIIDRLDGYELIELIKYATLAAADRFAEADLPVAIVDAVENLEEAIDRVEVELEGGSACPR